MKKVVIILLMSWLPMFVLASSGVAMTLEHVHIDLRNKAAITRGAHFFAKNCMVCHSMRYLTANKIAKQAGIVRAKMPLGDRKWWLGIAPPDLTLAARQRGADWLYTYMHAFYKDDARPTGYNNLLVPNSVMMNIFSPMQGVQVLKKPHKDSTQLFDNHQKDYAGILQLIKHGSMTSAEFDQATQDLVTFMVYASDPHAVERRDLGVWVLLFLIILFVFAYLLKKNYWQDVEK